MKYAPTDDWTSKVKIHVRQALFLKLDEIPRPLLDDISSTLTIENPKYLEAEKAGRWTGNLNKFLRYYEVLANEKDEKFLVLPRGFLPSLLKLCEQYQTRFILCDCTYTCKSVDFGSKIQLRDYQKLSVEAAIEKGGGVIVSPAGSGKTVMGLEIIARLQQPVLWITHTKELLYQAIDRAVQFLNITKDQIGIFGDGKRIIGNMFTVGLVQTLIKGIPDGLLTGVGTVILDEAHHCPAKSFLDVVSQFPAKYRYGLTATPYRKDGLTKPMYWTLGDKIYEVRTDTLMNEGKVIRPDVQFIETDFWYDYDDDFTTMITALTEDAQRNKLILEQLAPEALAGHFCIVLSERVEHCYVLQHLFSEAAPGISSDVFVGRISKNRRKEIVECLQKKELQVVFATNQLAEEGLDFPHLDRLFLTCPSRNRRKVKQAIGRIMRPCDDKEDAIVFDFVDTEVSLLASQARSRKWVYDELQQGKGGNGGFFSNIIL